MRLGLSTYSFWHFRGEPYPVLKIINMASKWDIGGIEILERQLTSKSLESLREIRREAYMESISMHLHHIRTLFHQILKKGLNR